MKSRHRPTSTSSSATRGRDSCHPPQALQAHHGDAGGMGTSLADRIDRFPDRAIICPPCYGAGSVGSGVQRPKPCEPCDRKGYRMPEGVADPGMRRR